MNNICISSSGVNQGTGGGDNFPPHFSFLPRFGKEKLFGGYLHSKTPFLVFTLKIKTNLLCPHQTSKKIFCPPPLIPPANFIEVMPQPFLISELCVLFSGLNHRIRSWFQEPNFKSSGRKNVIIWANVSLGFFQITVETFCWVKQTTSFVLVVRA